MARLIYYDDPESGDDVNAMIGDDINIDQKINAQKLSEISIKRIRIICKYLIKDISIIVNEYARNLLVEHFPINPFYYTENKCIHNILQKSMYYDFFMKSSDQNKLNAFIQFTKMGHEYEARVIFNKLDITDKIKLYKCKWITSTMIKDEILRCDNYKIKCKYFDMIASRKYDLMISISMDYCKYANNKYYDRLMNKLKPFMRDTEIMFILHIHQFYSIIVNFLIKNGILDSSLQVINKKYFDENPSIYENSAMALILLTLPKWKPQILCNSNPILNKRMKRYIPEVKNTRFLARDSMITKHVKTVVSKISFDKFIKLKNIDESDYDYILLNLSNNKLIDDAKTFELFTQLDDVNMKRLLKLPMIESQIRELASNRVDISDLKKYKKSSAYLFNADSYLLARIVSNMDNRYQDLIMKFNIKEIYKYVVDNEDLWL